MHIRYDDILRRIEEPPRWWANGVPRYDDFRPEDLDVYAREAALVHIRCQNCHTNFHVGIFTRFEFHGKNGDKTIEYALRGGLGICAGDPPNICCFPGNSMSSVEVTVIQFWKSDAVNPWIWHRETTLERVFVEE
ncbi:hypothetical protein [Methylorubrum sp. SB2]|uniref:hypothetical protein n=1 Tax=Methylorubrum subtropicum TaxID=3138812 RepID=UPI00313DB512